MARLPRLARRQPSGDSRPEKVPTTMVLKRRKDPTACVCGILGKLPPLGEGLLFLRSSTAAFPARKNLNKMCSPARVP